MRSFIILSIICMFILVYYRYQDLRNFIIDTNYQSNIQYVENISNNIVKFILKQVEIKGGLNNNLKEKKKSFISILKNNPLLRRELENSLNLFVTERYKYVYVVTKYKNSFQFLLDGSNDNEKALFLESYEPIEKRKWQQVLKTGKSIYFSHTKINTLWITYLKPIIKNGEVIAVLAIDFSLKEHNQIEKALDKLFNILLILIIFFVFIFIVILVYSYLDYKKQKSLEMLNATLEDRIKEEIKKNREKDKQLLYQSKLATMGEMISMIAHQWRQPLSAINAITISTKIKLFQREIDREFITKKMETILKYTDYLSHTIEDFRNFFKTTKEKKNVTYQKIIDSVLDIIEISLKNKNIELIKIIEFNKEICVFENELKQVILNLIRNAEDVLIERKIINPKIFISVFKKNDKILFQINDNAGGIDEKIMDKIFEPYFSTKDEKNGTGLGLYMSKIIVEEHLKGEIVVFNSDEGAVFQIILKDINC